MPPLVHHCYVVAVDALPVRRAVEQRSRRRVRREQRRGEFVLVEQFEKIPQVGQRHIAIVARDELAAVQFAAAVNESGNAGEDQISAMVPFIMSRGFSLTCNRFRYKYEIEDRGGNWEVTLK